MTLDISLNGMLVQAPRVFPVGSLVQVSLDLSPGTPPVRAAARVVRVVGDNCMGIQLENAGMTETERLQKFLPPLISATIDEDSPASPTA